MLGQAFARFMSASPCTRPMSRVFPRIADEGQDRGGTAFQALLTGKMPVPPKRVGPAAQVQSDGKPRKLTIFSIRTIRAVYEKLGDKKQGLNSETLYYFCRAPAICSLVPRTDLCNSLSRTRHLEFGRAPTIYAYPRKRQRLVPVVASFCQSRSGALDNLALTSSAPTPLRDQTGSKTLICSYLAFQHSTLSITSSSPHLEGHLKQALPGRQNRVRTTCPRRVFPSAVQGSGDLYINPQVKSVAPLAGTGTPVSLGGSTGAPIQLQNGNSLTLTTNYTDGSPRTGGM